MISMRQNASGRHCLGLLGKFRKGMQTTSIIIIIQETFQKRTSCCTCLHIYPLETSLFKMLQYATVTDSGQLQHSVTKCSKFATRHSHHFTQPARLAPCVAVSVWHLGPRAHDTVEDSVDLFGRQSRWADGVEHHRPHLSAARAAPDRSMSYVTSNVYHKNEDVS